MYCTDTWAGKLGTKSSDKRLTTLLLPTLFLNAVVLEELYISNLQTSPKLVVYLSRWWPLGLHSGIFACGVFMFSLCMSGFLQSPKIYFIVSLQCETLRQTGDPFRVHPTFAQQSAPKRDSVHPADGWWPLEHHKALSSVLSAHSLIGGWLK